MKGIFLKNCLITILAINFLMMPVLALELDTSIDDEIRKNYNPSKLEDDVGLPALPKVLQDNPAKINTPANQNKSIQPVHKSDMTPIQKSQIKFKASANKSARDCFVLKKGTKIRLKLLNNISDKSKRGTRLTFVSTYPVTSTYITIPMGTIFKGEIVKTHGPQLTGNGGLIVLRINSMNINNEIQPIEANVVKANSKMIYFNNIKGKRKYVASVFKSTKPGCRFFKKMMSVTKNLAFDGSSIIISPFSLCAGIIGLGGNIIVSPVLATFYKGNQITINSGSEFKVKLMQDVFVYK